MVTDARQRFDVPCAFGRVGKRSPEAINRGVQATLEVDVSSVRPQPPAEFLTRDNITRSLEQRAKNEDWLGLHFETNAEFGKLTGFHSELRMVRIAESGEFPKGFLTFICEPM